MAVSLEVRIDFLSHLPPEIVFEILIHLPIADVLRCLRVSSEWHERILGMRYYWKGPALNSLGVSEHVVEQSKRHYKDCKDLAVRVYKNRRYVRASSPEAKQLSQIYLNRYYQCNYFKYGVLVGTMYEDFIPLFTSVSTMAPNTGLLKRTHSFLPPSQESAHRVVWSSLYCDYILLASASGRWRGYNLVTGEAMLSWQGPTLYDPDQLICCCQDCFLVVLGKIVVGSHSLSSDRQGREIHWELQIIRIGRGNAKPSVSHVRLRVALMGSSLPGVSVLAQYSKCIALISQSKDSSSQFCQSHWLLLQCGRSVCIHRMESNVDCEALSPLVDLHYASSICEQSFIEKHHSTQFTLSSDQSLLAYAVNGVIQVWSLNNDFKCVSCFRLQSLQDGVQVSILGVGHIYVIVGYGSDKGKVQVLSTYTGEVIFGVHGFSGLAEASTIGTPPPYFIFLGLTDEEWLNRVDILPNPCLPILLYWDKLKHCVFGIVFKHHNEETQRIESGKVDISSHQIGFMDKIKSFMKI